MDATSNGSSGNSSLVSNVNQGNSLLVIKDEIPSDVCCPILLEKMTTLFQERVALQAPHMIACIKSEGGTKTFFDAHALSEHLATHTQWTNPITQSPVQSVTYYTRRERDPGYKKFKKIFPPKRDDFKFYHKFWICSNMAAATQLERFDAYLANIATMQNVQDTNRPFAKWQLFLHIEKCYGKGIARLFTPIIQMKDSFEFQMSVANRLFQEGLPYGEMDELIKGTEIEKLTIDESFFTRDDPFPPLPTEKKACKGYQFGQYLLSVPQKNQFNWSEINEADCELARILSIVYVSDHQRLEKCLTEYPNWTRGKIQKFKDQLRVGQLSNNDILDFYNKMKSLNISVLDDFLEILSLHHINQIGDHSFSDFVCRILSFSYSLSYPLVHFGEVLRSRDEVKSALECLKLVGQPSPGSLFEYHLCLTKISLGLKNFDENHYHEGVELSLKHYEKSTSFNLYSYANILSELNPFLTKPNQLVEILSIVRQNLEKIPKDCILLKNYYLFNICYGTTADSNQTLVNVQKSADSDLGARFKTQLSARHALRFSCTEGLAEVEKSLQTITPPQNPGESLCHALFHAHPLRRKFPEWYLTAHRFFQTPLKDSRRDERIFLRDHLQRWDHLSTDEQDKCRHVINSFFNR